MVVSDGSEGANRAVDVAAGLAKALNGILWIVTIRDVKLLANHMKEIRHLGISENLLERFTKQILTEAKERANRLGVSDVRIHALEGDAAETIIDLVARFSQIEGYRCLSLIRALGVVNCQLALVLLALRPCSQTAIPSMKVWLSG